MLCVFLIGACFSLLLLFVLVLFSLLLVWLGWASPGLGAGSGWKVAAARRPEAVRRAGNPRSRIAPIRVHIPDAQRVKPGHRHHISTARHSSLYMHAFACPSLPFGEIRPEAGEDRGRGGGMVLGRKTEREKNGPRTPHAGAGLVWACAVGP
jgi:hypothetical protein